MITLFGAKTRQRVIKDLSNSGSFFLFSVPEHFVVLSTGKFHIFLKNIRHKKSKNWKGFFVKESPLKNFINAIRDVTCKSFHHFSQPLR